MKQLFLKRIAETHRRTFGVLLCEGIPFAVTLELPWRENHRNISRIPAGNHICKRYQSPRFGETFEIVDVPGRTKILFHTGNVVGNTHGCILVGEEFGFLDGERAILSSRKAFREFISLFEHDPAFELIITEHF